MEDLISTLDSIYTELMIEFGGDSDEILALIDEVQNKIKKLEANK